MLTTRPKERHHEEGTRFFEGCGTKDRFSKRMRGTILPRELRTNPGWKDHLIGFNNGIFDLNKTSSEKVVQGPGVYVHGNRLRGENDEVLFEEIDDFFGRCSPTKICVITLSDVSPTSYLVTYLGRNSIFSGSGSNGNRRRSNYSKRLSGSAANYLHHYWLERAAAGTP
jgi:hypothetical protein